MRNIKLTIAYDGTNYLGWQKTAAGPSIEEALQHVLEQILQHEISLQAASRTDAGVHARGQIVNFFTGHQNLDFEKFRYSLNSLLPKDLVVLEVEEMPFTFHPTLDCIEKEYRYFICYGEVQLPQNRLYAWHCPYLLDVQAMRKASHTLVGKHDFAAFCNAKQNEYYEDHIRTVNEISILEHAGNRLEIVIKGQNFLYKMVRNIVGTLVYVGRERISPEEVAAILNSRHRPQAGVTAPAEGLTLHKVFYKNY